MADNNVTLVGNTTRDWELRFSAAGTAIASGGIAVNNRRKVGDEYEDESHFFNLTCFGSLAENVCESVPKGTRIVVAGRLQFRQWESQEGDKRSAVDVVVDSIGPDLRWATAQVTKTEKRTEGR